MFDHIEARGLVVVVGLELPHSHIQRFPIVTVIFGRNVLRLKKGTDQYFAKLYFP